MAAPGPPYHIHTIFLHLAVQTSSTVAAAEQDAPSSQMADGATDGKLTWLRRDTAAPIQPYETALAADPRQSKSCYVMPEVGKAGRQLLSLSSVMYWRV